MNRQSQTQRRGGFTLVELLVVVLIVTILATVVLFAMFAATEAAREARTRSVIMRINDLLTPMWESYRTRRVPLDIPPGTPPVGTDIAPGVAYIRVDTIRELMRLELPDRKSDVVDGPVTVGLARPSLSRAYHRGAMARTGSSDPTTIENWTVENQGSECLYLILSRIQDGDTNGLEFLRETEIVDTDGDGLPEIVDGWGTPIRLLRWAPGFIPSNGGNSALQDGLHANGPDAFDPMNVRADLPGDGQGLTDADGVLDTFYLFPLVMSAGPDREWDIAFDDSPVAFSYASTTPPNDPYQTTVSMGIPDDNNNNDGGTPQEHLDNIHNHLLSTATQ